MNGLMTVAEACAYLRQSRSSLYRAVKRGELPVVKLGRSTRFLLAHLDEYIGENLIDAARRIEMQTARINARRIYQRRFGETG
ncbi:MAG TPA: helix-turn-helix domain-containing protein [Armatimonadota bacterium]|nr:helix-turn-helix domain-containing protein [Armatimonadota bacterium]